MDADKTFIFVLLLVGWLDFFGISTFVGHLTPNPIFMKIVLFQTIQFSISAQFNCKYSLIVKKTFLFQAIQFTQAVLIQLIHFSTSTDLAYTQLNVKTVLY